MAKDHYFDISAKLDMMELKNALVMAEKVASLRAWAQDRTVSAN